MVVSRRKNRVVESRQNKRMLGDRGRLLTEEGDLIRENRACARSWLREDTEGKSEEMNKKTKEDGK